MRNIFEGQLPLDNDASEAVKEDAFVVLDTNALLDLYRYSKDTSAEFLGILESIGDDLWMPHQVGWEFLRRRSTLRASATLKHDERLKALAELKKAIGKTGGIQSHVGGDDDEETFERALKSYTDRLKNHRKAIGEWSTITTDDLLEQILDLYEGRTGEAPSQAWYSEQREIGAARYDQGIPPGYMDGSKQSNRFGDFFIWWQCIEHSKACKRPLIFVTGDSKEDWWEQVGGGVKSPHTELLQEFWDETGQRFILMDPISFYDEFRPEQNADEPAGTSTRDEIVATQATERQFDSLTSQFQQLNALQNSMAQYATSTIDSGLYENVRASLMHLSKQAAASYDPATFDRLRASLYWLSQDHYAVPSNYASDSDDEDVLFPVDTPTAEDLSTVAGDEERRDEPASKEPDAAEEDDVAD